MDSTVNHWMVKSKSSGSTPEALYEDAKQYFMWCESNPIYKNEIIKQTGLEIRAEFPRPFNLPALCIHCGVSVQYINEMARNYGAGDYNKVAQWILQVIYAQNLEFAMVGIFSAVVTAKKLNLGSIDESKDLPAVVNLTLVKSDETPQLGENEIEETVK